MPICNYEGDVIGVAQIINKTNGKFNFFFIYRVGIIFFRNFCNYFINQKFYMQ